MNVVSFTEFVPEPRFDGISWTQVQIEEAAVEAGPYTLIDTLSVGADADPAHPAPRSFTTHQAAIQNGWYRITFLNAAGTDRSPVTPVHFSTPGNSDYLPTVSRVAREIMSRTRDQFGNSTGTFTATTTPTDTQVLAISQDVITEVADVVGDEIPEALWDDAQNVVALRTAMQIESTYYAEQIASNRSPYPMLEKRYEDALVRLQRAVEVYNEDGDGTVGSSGPSGMTSYSFPVAVPWLGRLM